MSTRPSESKAAFRLALLVTIAFTAVLFAPLGLRAAPAAFAAGAKTKKPKHLPDVSNTPNESTDVTVMLQTAANTKLELSRDEINKILADPYWVRQSAKDIKKTVKHCNNPKFVWRDVGTPINDAASECGAVGAWAARDLGPENAEAELALQRACALPRYPDVRMVFGANGNYCAELGDLYRARACVLPKFSYSTELYSDTYGDYCRRRPEADVRARYLGLALAVYQKASNCRPFNFTPSQEAYFDSACPVGAAEVLIALGQETQGQAALRSACSGFSPLGGYPAECAGFVPQPQQTESAPADNDAPNTLAESANRQDIQGKIDNLNQQIQQLESDANDAEQQADNLASNSNCTGGYGPYAAIAQQGCENINSIGVAKFRSEAARDRNQADDDQAEIERLQGEQVQEAPHRDASFAGALTQQMQQNPQPSIVDTANQQAANMMAVGAANDAARQRQEQEAEQQREHEAQQQATTSSVSAPSSSTGPEICPSTQYYPDGGRNCNPVRDMTSCIRVDSASFRSDGGGSSLGEIDVTVTNTCPGIVEVKIWGSGTEGAAAELNTHFVPGAQEPWVNLHAQNVYHVVADDGWDCTLSINPNRPGCAQRPVATDGP